MGEGARMSKKPAKNPAADWGKRFEKAAAKPEKPTGYPTPTKPGIKYRESFDTKRWESDGMGTEQRVTPKSSKGMGKI